MKWITPIFIILIFFYSCKESMQAGIIGPQKMQVILWDVLRADALSRELVRTDSSKSMSTEVDRLRSQVFLIHKITGEQFVKSYSFYTRNPGILKRILDSLNSQQVRISTLEIPVEKNRIKDSVGK